MIKDKVRLVDGFGGVTQERDAWCFVYEYMVWEGSKVFKLKVGVSGLSKE